MLLFKLGACGAGKVVKVKGREVQTAQMEAEKAKCNNTSEGFTNKDLVEHTVIRGGLVQSDLERKRINVQVIL